jgi:hypothetical protein
MRTGNSQRATAPDACASPFPEKFFELLSGTSEQRTVLAARVHRPHCLPPSDTRLAAAITT